jgi:DNA-3-methyladenine glycosylase II
MNFSLSDAQIKTALDTVAATNSHVPAAVKLAGCPAERINPQGFATVLRVIVGQQLSVKAAATIWGRVHTLARETAGPDGYKQRAISR